MLKKKSKYLLYIKKRSLILVFFTYFIIAFYRLNEIPGEWFGDISILHEYVLSILKGGWPWHFSLSAGPFYHYLIAPLIFVIGQNYLQYKIASVVVGAVGIYFIYLMSMELAGEKIALLTAFISGVSFWTIVWARLGNSQIVIPFLVASIFYFSQKFIKNSNKRYLLLAILTSSVGLFTYPQTFVLPILLIFWLVIGGKGRGVKFSLLAFIPFTLLFLVIVLHQKQNFTTGYLGSKMPKLQQLLQIKTYGHMGIRVIRTMGMFHFKGEEGFRVNVSNTSHLDPISGLFLFLGIFYWLKKNPKVLMLFILSFFILILPSVSPNIPLRETPNIGRTFGVVPLVYLMVASGIYFLYENIRSKKFKFFYLVGVLLMVTFLNLYKYFVLYPNNLPNRNVAFGKRISEYINGLPTETKVLLTACCWGKWGQPEPKAVYYNLKDDVRRGNIIPSLFLSSCYQISGIRNIAVIFNPSDLFTISRYKGCFPDGKFFTYREKGQDVFSALYIE